MFYFASPAARVVRSTNGRAIATSSARRSECTAVVWDGWVDDAARIDAAVDVVAKLAAPSLPDGSGPYR
jgi:hypothetical protein